ncbi:MAG TPA: cupin domain-containing protein, partial [Gemmatimonadales bacterium]|nr:cupin domain-containing protein [Gemmatimonadales bacterium]
MTYFLDPASSAVFRPETFAKADLARGARLFLGLNCFVPGQRQAAHTHAGADKFYLVVSGKARMTVGTETRVAGPGALVWAPAGVPHGVDEALERTVLLVGIAPPPATAR